MTVLIVVWIVVLIPLVWLTLGKHLRRPQWQSVLRIRILACLGALVTDGRRAAGSTWRQKDMAQEAYRRRM